MTDFWRTILFASVWTLVVMGIPAFFATRAVLTGRIYDEASRRQSISRAEDPGRFWGKVMAYYALSLLGLLPWVLIAVFGLKKQ